MLASIGAGAKRGLLIKGGKYLETLARADVLLVDKTGTLTENQMTVRRVFAGLRSYCVSGEGYDPRGGLMREDNQARVVDPPGPLECLLEAFRCVPPQMPTN